MGNLNRGKMYLSIINFLMIFKVFLDTLDVNAWAYPVGLVVGIAGTVVIGWVDKRLGVRKEEQNYTSRQNPVLMRILKILEDDRTQERK